MRQKQVKGFQTGDRVKAVVTQGKKIGTYIGRVAVRATGSFNIQTAMGLIQGIGYQHCQLMQRAEGYGYHWITEIALGATFCLSTCLDSQRSKARYLSES